MYIYAYVNTYVCIYICIYVCVCMHACMNGWTRGPSYPRVTPICVHRRIQNTKGGFRIHPG